MERISWIQNLSIEEKWHLLENILVFSCIISVAFCFSSLFTNGVWGYGASFQLVSTAILNAIFCAYTYKCVHEQTLHHLSLDYFGGIATMLTFLLLQTMLLWGDFASGLDIQRGPGGFSCKVEHTAAERAVTALSSISFLTLCGFLYLAYTWKNELFDTGFDSYRKTYKSPTGGEDMNFEHQGYQQERPSTSQPDGKFRITSDDAEL